MDRTSNLRIESIDGLRGIAALYVVVGHAICDYYFKISSDVALPFELLKQLTSGLMGVFLFFLISGYVIPSSFRGEGGSSFLVRRFFRLYPIFWVSILPDLLRFAFRGCNDFSLSELLANITMVPKLFNQRFICDVFWTLAHEWLFYFLCLILFFAGWIQESRKIALCVLTTGLGYWVLKWGQWVGWLSLESSFFQKTVLLTLSIMFWGALWRLYQEKKWSGWLEKGALLFIPLQYLILSLCRLFYTQAEAKLYFPLSFGSSIGCAIALFLLGTTYFKIKNPLLVWCGTVSYSIYLFHMMVVAYLKRWVGSPSLFTFVALVVLGSCIVAAFGYYLVERPAIRFSKLRSRKEQTWAESKKG